MEGQGGLGEGRVRVRVWGRQVRWSDSVMDRVLGQWHRWGFRWRGRAGAGKGEWKCRGNGAGEGTEGGAGLGQGVLQVGRVWDTTWGRQVR